MVSFNMSNFTQEWSRNYAAQKNLIVNQLFNKASELEEKLSKNFNSYDQDILKRTKEDLDCFCLEKAKGIMFRTKAKYTVEAERNAKYFFSLEKLKTASLIIDDNGQKITKQNEILEEQHRFYQELYKEDQDINFTEINSIVFKSVMSSVHH